MKRIKFISYGLILFLLISGRVIADPTDITLEVWANEAIISTYTYTYENFFERQKEIAKYFTAKGWINYSQALTQSKLPAMVKSNQYRVTAVATLPPQVKSLNNALWRVTMPILVSYKNPQYQQKQYLNVAIDVVKAPNGQGVRGLAIVSLRAKETTNPCPCQKTKKDSKQST